MGHGGRLAAMGGEGKGKAGLGFCLNSIGLAALDLRALGN